MPAPRADATSGDLPRSPAIDATVLRRLRAQAARLSRRAADVDDLVQEVLLAAILAGRTDAAWLAGTLRRQAAMAARGAVRRRRREDAAGQWLQARDPCDVVALPALPTMPLAARRVARLALHGLDAAEIRWLLGISPQAFRQRLVSIRKSVASAPADVRAALQAFAAAPASRCAPMPRPMGPIRCVLQHAALGSALGTHDPSGQLLLIRRGAHTSAPGGNVSA
ncbi:sigma-70 family RNA polymerase sigma factor [Luteimonas sp. RC10]|uniref:sigma-70 family RNA polymerase sigma factor n=1 Tax=Luteimonas sp. RC10 TaxID=2587035 RepID=UPI00161BBD51|nr:sigma-70 family RNA polymerase sigma factor [Luteimonas sp. RC10]MBB3345089.1 RNA polymerase sigma-70 factor (ECF subfamily) [Luteimonas sp. RC10]